MSIGGLKKAWVLNSRHTPEGLPPPPICMQQPSRRLQRQLWDSASSWAPMSQPSPAHRVWKMPGTSWVHVHQGPSL